MTDTAAQLLGVFASIFWFTLWTVLSGSLPGEPSLLINVGAVVLGIIIGLVMYIQTRNR